MLMRRMMAAGNLVREFGSFLVRQPQPCLFSLPTLSGKALDR